MKFDVFHFYVTGILFVVNVSLVLLFLKNGHWSGSFLNFLPPSYIHSSLHSLQSEITLLDSWDVYEKYPIDLNNASAVFNTVQGALKQKDSNTHPVGVSFIPAYIPANTRLYHSRPDGNLPDLYEWIAFSYEFSYLFGGFSRRVNQSSDGIDPRERKRKFLFSFRTKVPLDKVIYLDGASAAKIFPELDQQEILANISSHEGYFNEREAADKICKWGESFGLQGFIRLEIGFEMILCNFHKNVELISNITVPYAGDVIEFPPEDPEYVPSPRRPPPMKPPATIEQQVLEAPKTEPDYESLSHNRSLLLSHLSTMVGYEWSQSGSMVDHGEPRILLDLSSMVTPLNKTYIDPDSYVRNISYISQDLKGSLINQLEHVYEIPTNPFFKNDWPILTYFIVQKFGPFLMNLNKTLTNFDDLKVSGDQMQLLTFNIVRRYYHDEINDPTIRRETAIKDFIQDYVYNTFPLVNTDILIYSSIFKVQYELVHLVFDVFDVSKAITHQIYITSADYKFEEELEQIKERVTNLIQLFDWSMFYQCSNKCGFDEICLTPTWGPSPIGWGPKEDRSFSYKDGVFRINREFQCVKYTDMLRNTSSLN